MSRTALNLKLITEFLDFLIDSLILEHEYYTYSSMNCTCFALILLGNAFLSKCCVRWICTEVNVEKFLVKLTCLKILKREKEVAYLGQLQVPVK